MFGFLGSYFSDSPATVEDCDNIEYTPAGEGDLIVVDDPAGDFSGIVPLSSLPVDIQESIVDAVDSQTPL